MVYLVGPVTFVMLGGACYIGYKLDSTRHAQIRAELEARDALEPGGSMLGGMGAEQLPPGAVVDAV